MRKTSLLLILLTMSWLIMPARGQDNPNTITFSKRRQFAIPFGPPTQKLRSLQLYVSTDQGRTWQLHATALPEQGRFLCSLDRDGSYWFTVQITDTDNKSTPESLNGAQPSIKVVVDTKPPVVTLQALVARGGEVGVSWEIREDNPDMALADALRLEYRQAGTTNWIPLPISPTAKQHYWNPQTTSLVEVRLRARDVAGNWGEGSTTVGLNGNSSGFVTPPDGGVQKPPFVPPNPMLPSDLERRFVNSKKITLNYELSKVGPSGVSQIDLWYTLDGRTWNRYEELKFGSDTSQKSVTFEVAGEGVYGFSLIARSGVGLGERPPQTGDRPQIWIEVDSTKPAVQLHNVVVGRGPDEGKMTITWSARDKNLQPEPITLSYAEQPTGPWTKFAEKLPNTPRFVWTIPANIPYKVYIKVEAFDRANNVGEAISSETIVDLSTPSAIIKGAEPGR